MKAVDILDLYPDRIMPDPNSGCWLWTGSQVSAGYGNFQRDGGWHYAHRYSFEMANGKGSADGLVVRHACDTPCCVNPNHLLGGTHKDNVADMWERGRANPAKGSDASRAILTEADVLEARRMASNGEALCEIAHKFPVGRSTIESAVKGWSWRHLPGAVSQPRKKRTTPPRAKGSENHRATLTEPQVREIKERISQGHRGADLAREFGVTPSVVCSIKTGKTWRHV